MAAFLHPLLAFAAPTSTRLVHKHFSCIYSLRHHHHHDHHHYHHQRYLFLFRNIITIIVVGMHVVNIARFDASRGLNARINHSKWCSPIN